MELTITVYTTTKLPLRYEQIDSKQITINEGEMDEIIIAYLKREHLSPGETLVSLSYEEARPYD